MGDGIMYGLWGGIDHMDSENTTRRTGFCRELSRQGAFVRTESDYEYAD